MKERVKELCKTKGISMNTAEKSIGIARGYISKLDKSNPNMNTLQKIADYFGVTVDYLISGETTNRVCSPCPSCGLSYDETSVDDVTYHKQHHAAWEKANEKFGPLYCNYSENEAIKATNRNISHDLSHSLEERYEAQLKVLRCLFSRSIAACDFDLSHVSFEKYVSMLLGNGSYKKNLEDDLYKKLVDTYGTLSGIPYGSVYYTPASSYTLAAHFNGDEYTEDELKEIYQFAEFVKNRKK